jgi:hypothetical protein
VRMKRIVILLMFIVCYQVSFAQYNDSTHYYLKYASTGAINKTNEGNSYLLNNAFKVGINKKTISLNANGAWVYGNQERNKLTNNDWSFSVDFDLYKSSKHIYYWGLMLYDKSFSLKINNRFQTGFGAAYDIVDKKNLMINISDGLLYEKGDLFLNDTTHDVYNTARNSFRLMFKWVIRDIIVLDGTHYIQNALNYKRDFIIKTNANLSIRLRKWLSITASMTYNQVSRTQRENMLINYGITVEKYF